MKFAALVAALILASAPAWATTPARSNDFQNVRLVSVYDGDTIKVTLSGVHPLFGRKISVRILGIDTPEIRGKCAAEKTKAKAARDFLKGVLKRASRIDLRDAKRGKYFRILARVSADGQDVAALLIRKGHGRPYNGGRRRGWCG